MDPTGYMNLIFPLLVLVPLMYLMLKQLLISGPPLPPGPRPWPIIGNILHIGTRPHFSMAKLAQLHGPLISLKLGSQLLVVGSSSSAAAAILKTHDRLLSARSVPRLIFTNGFDLDRHSLLWADCTARWRSVRALLRSDLFSNTALDSSSIVREGKVRDLVQFLCTKQGQAVKIADVVSTAVYNSMTTTLMSKDFCFFEDGERSALKEASERAHRLGATPDLADLYPALSIFDVQGLKKKTSDLAKDFSAMWEDDIKERRENTCVQQQKQPDDGDGDFLDVLLAKGFEDDQINYLITELSATGTTTVVATVEWAMAELMNNKEAMEKVRQEMEKELESKQGDVIKETHLSKLPYLLACVKETLRLNPAVPLLLPHRALETCEVINYTIPKDTKVLVNLWAIGRDPAVWEDPLSFKPERFLHSNSKLNSQGHDYLPFGAGRRVCPGYSLATKQVPLVLANLIHHFDWHLPNDQLLDMTDKFTITLHMEKPLCLIPRIRTKM